MSKSFDIFYASQLEAIYHKLNSSDITLEGKVRRWYASTLGISFSDTFNLSWPHLLQQYYQNQVESSDYNKIYDLAIQTYIPELATEIEEELQDFADSLADEQERTLNRKNKKELKVPEYNIDFEEEDLDE
ncbi:MAG TPA: hypothetical protein VI911_12080 [Patescibacteria group bacterium]|nr:hypothetical protein [Patescibacteria group bacterium]